MNDSFRFGLDSKGGTGRFPFISFGPGSKFMLISTQIKELLRIANPYNPDLWSRGRAELLRAVRGLIRYPRCIDGMQACPSEDCGGPWGYADLLELIQDAKHPEHDERMEWTGAEFDPEAFDLDAVNAELL